MSHDVFISHSIQDKPIADAVCATLESHRIRCWIAPRDIQPGADGDEAIMDALTDCKIVVLVFSSHANDSLHIQSEVQKAFEKGAPLILFRVEDVAPARSLHQYLKNASWLDAFHPSFLPYLAELGNRVRTMVPNSQTPAFGNGGDARDVLRQIIAAYGSPVANDLRRLEALLHDLCGDRKQETRLLISAGQEGVSAELLSPAVKALPQELLLSRLTLRLEEHLLVPQNVARWAVESWALALGCMTAGDLTTHKLNINQGPTPVVPIVPPAGAEPEAKAEPEVEEAPPLPKTPAPDTLLLPKAMVTTKPRLRRTLLWIGALLVLVAIGIPSYLHYRSIRSPDRPARPVTLPPKIPARPLISTPKDQAYLNQRLLAAASKNPPDSAEINKALQEGADVNAKDKDGETPLMWAAFFGNAAAVQLLINKGADVNAKDKDGATALDLALAFKHADCVAILQAASAKSR